MLSEKTMKELLKEEKALNEVFNDNDFKNLTIDEQLEIVDKLRCLQMIRYAYKRYNN